MQQQCDVRDTKSQALGNGVAVIRASGPRSDVVTVGLDRAAPMHEGSRRSALQHVAIALGLGFEAEALGRLPSVRPLAQGGLR